MATWSRLVRFLSTDGRVLYGDAILSPGLADAGKAKTAKVIKGDPLGKYEVTEEIASIAKLHSPLAPSAIGTVRCLGLNYARHAHETNLPIPTYPVLFYKPSTSIAGPSDPIPIPHLAQEKATPKGGGGLDFECELVAVIGKPARNVSESSALDYVAGYTAGNDVSHREWQINRGGSQWSLGKGFDGWAPMGPAVVAPGAIGGDPQALRLWTKVNGVLKQDSSTADQIFGVAKAVSFLSQGTTLLPGDVIFTGTPEGVGMGRKPQEWLKDGDVVEVAIDGIGSCVNKVVHEKPQAKL